MSKDILGDLMRGLLKRIAELPCETLGAICDVAEKLASEDGREWFVELKKFLRKEKCWLEVVVQPFLNLISDGESLVIKAKTGRRRISQMKDLFTWGIDSDFVNYGADQEGPATEDVKVEVYELVKDGNFSDIFGSLPSSRDQRCLTQDQIIGFVEEHHRWLSTNGTTFFLFKSSNEYFVAHVYVNSDGRLHASVHRLEDTNQWDAEYHHRFVVLRLA
jgi:hypothetical protein